MVSPHRGEGGPGGTLGRVPRVMCPAGGDKEGCRCSLRALCVAQSLQLLIFVFLPPEKPSRARGMESGAGHREEGTDLPLPGVTAMEGWPGEAEEKSGEFLPWSISW